MAVNCPICSQRIAQSRNREGPNYCTVCGKLFYVAEEPPMPPWILGVLVILVANWQIMSR